MKKQLLLTLASFLVAFNFTFAQVMYTDNFESYNVGQGVALQSTWWNTWSGTPGSNEDPLVSDSFAYSGVNAVRVFGTNDGVIELNDLDSNRYRIEFYLYIPAGKQAYYNVMQNFDPAVLANNIWGMQVYFQNGIVTIDGNGEAAATFAYQSNTWLKIQHFIDLDNDLADVYVNDTLVHTYKWSNGAYNDGTGIKKLDALNFYAWNVDGVNDYYLDNFLIEKVPSPEPAQNFTLQIVNNNDVKLDWNTPTNDAPLSYAVSRDGQIIATVTNDSTYTDVNLYPNSYTYQLFAYYGNSLGYSASADSLNATIPGGNQRQSVLFEIFTGTWCSYCPTAARSLTLMENEGSNIAEINYHGGDTYETSATAVRAGYYEPLLFNGAAIGYPGSVINGMYGFDGALPSVTEHKAVYDYYYEKFLDIPAIYTIDASVSNISGFPYSFTLGVDVEETFPYYNDEMRLMVALTETNIPENWGGLTLVNNVLRKMYPNVNGTLLDFTSSSTLSNSFVLTLEAGYNPLKTKAVIFVQNKATGQVLEAEVIDLGALVNSIENKTNTLSFGAFPNPAQNFSTVSFSDLNNDAMLEILDVTGRILDTYKVAAHTESLTISTSHYQNGTYFYRLISENRIEGVKKMVVVK